MEGIVLEKRGGVAAALREDGVVVTTRQPCGVGERIELKAGTVPCRAGGRRWMRGAVAAALAIVVAGSSYTYAYATPCSYVSLDVEESSVEFSVNRLDRVIGVRALNDDSEELARALSGDVRHRKVGDAVERTVTRMRSEGRLDGEDVVIAGVASDMEERGAALSEAVENSAGDGGVTVYIFTVSRGERDEALERQRSTGRYAFEQRGVRDEASGAGEATAKAAPQAPSGKDGQPADMPAQAPSEEAARPAEPDGGAPDGSARDWEPPQFRPERQRQEPRQCDAFGFAPQPKSGQPSATYVPTPPTLGEVVA